MSLKIILLTPILFFSLNIIAQEKKSLITAIKGGVQVTYSENGSGGLGFTYEPKHNINNTNALGLRLGGAFGFGRRINSIDESKFEISADLLNLSFFGHLTATYEKHFRSNQKLFNPFIGGGIGYYKTTNQDFEILENDILSINRQKEKAKAKGQVLFLIRSGFDIGKFRLGLEYNYIPTVDFEISNRKKIASSKGSFTALSIGYTVDWQ